ncbi:enoyl-CoA hydratase/isomerase family protein [Novosphingobium sp. JCM 18896]|uniref:enoyl-CoA hydratase/isomerase family protein n=1 Tax=Novosphingobium sp. JCM 18896 TaxID=2989731 RepID=UPI00222311A7|nr:enoyl-CoA hydratase/isomerase family protein [Novosphingobium sp. JCM 18896]MCW1432287.1 enoyl-CoA hydratase/isomerase family protein [Novosphingobium sp. JCM 18896]
MIDYEIREGAAWLTLNRPEKHNALRLDAWQALPDLIARAIADASAAAVILKGKGPSFCTGADITSFGDLADAEDRHRVMTSINSAMIAVEACTKPVIAAVHGYVLGGGCELTMMADIVIADSTSRFGLPEIKAGFMPGPGLVRGSSHVSLHVIKYMALTGETLDADEALHAGLVNKVVAPGLAVEEAAHIAKTMAQRSGTALAEMKRFLNAQEPSAWPHVTSSLAYVFGTKGACEGIAKYGRR